MQQRLEFSPAKLYLGRFNRVQKSLIRILPNRFPKDLLRIMAGAPPATTALVRLWDPTLIAAAFSGASGIRCPTADEKNAVGDALQACTNLKVTEQTDAVGKLVENASKPCSVSLDQMLKNASSPPSISDMVDALRTALWLSPPTATTIVGPPAKTAVVYEGGIRKDSTDVLVAGKTYDVYEVFFKTPCILYRTVLQTECLRG